MPDTFQALAVVFVALLPGALYTWSFERQVGQWGIALSDRILRFVGTSAVFHAFLAPVTYWVYAEQIATGRLARGAPLSLWWWLTVFAYVFVPYSLGLLVGYATRKHWWWATLLTGRDAAPRAWDYLFGAQPAGYVRLRLKSGGWLAGYVGTREDGRRRAYFAGLPHPQDLYLAETYALDESNAIQLGEDGLPVVRGTALLVRWDEVEYLEIEEHFE
jgi:hypothetical protein